MGTDTTSHPHSDNDLTKNAGVTLSLLKSTKDGKSPESLPETKTVNILTHPSAIFYLHLHVFC